MNKSTQNLLPVSGKTRILYLDILRGIAILFIFLANIYIFSGLMFVPEAEKATFSTASFDYFLEVCTFIFIDGKFYSIFSILFGIGFVIQYNSAKKSGIDFTPFFRRRMLGLLLIGGLHLFFIWLGDILTLYALLGLVLIAFQNFSDKRLLRWAAILLILPVIHLMAMSATGVFYPYALFGALDQYSVARGLPLRDWLNTGIPTFDYLEYMRIESFVHFMEITIAAPLLRLGLILLEGRLFKVLALFLIGVWAGRQILNKNILENNRFLKNIAIWGLIVGIPMNLLRTYAEFGGVSGDLWTLLSYVFYAGGVVPLACAYCAIIALIVKKHPLWLKWFAPVGRTALSNYVFQSLIAITIFYGIGFGYGGNLGLTTVFLICFAIFGWQVLFSTLWLKIFRYGPLEWIWRQITYGKFLDPRIKIKDIPPAVVTNK